MTTDSLVALAQQCLVQSIQDHLPSELCKVITSYLVPSQIYLVMQGHLDTTESLNWYELYREERERMWTVHEFGLVLDSINVMYPTVGILLVQALDGMMWEDWILKRQGRTLHSLLEDLGEDIHIRIHFLDLVNCRVKVADSPDWRPCRLELTETK